MARNYHLTGLEPASVWENFYAISQIPRETGNPEGITSYLLDFCKAHGIEAYRDEAYNVIARVPATPGYENASPVILHSHSDMVCIKDEGVDHDFAKDPIRVYAEGDVVTAEGTTLGGDDGIGEIGFFTTRIPGLNAVSLTPNAFNCHSTQEYLSIRECRYFYDKMAELLEKMKDM